MLVVEKSTGYDDEWLLRCCGCTPNESWIGLAPNTNPTERPCEPVFGKCLGQAYLILNRSSTQSISLSPVHVCGVCGCVSRPLSVKRVSFSVDRHHSILNTSFSLIPTHCPLMALSSLFSQFSILIQQKALAPNKLTEAC